MQWKAYSSPVHTDAEMADNMSLRSFRILNFFLRSFLRAARESSFAARRWRS